MGFTNSISFHKKSRLKVARFRKVLPFLLFVLSVILFLTFLVSTGTTYTSNEINEPHFSRVRDTSHVQLDPTFKPKFPKQTDMSVSLEQRNHLPPKNLHLFPRLAKDHVKIVLYVHNRPQYLQLVVRSLSNVEGIGETMLIVSHDGYFSEMDRIVGGIKFCQVKQIFAPYSPHLYTGSFPGMSLGDCDGKDVAVEKKCRGNADQYGNHRSPKIVSLKHHWWWMMNKVWDGLKETKGYSGHVVFIEEDHFIYPNAYRNIQMLTRLKHSKCPDCYAANLAPSDVNSKGERWPRLIAEKIGNVGYAFNRTVWRKIHAKAKEFCTFDEYNWDITMWATVYPSLGSRVFSLRGPRRSAAHFGKCGLHQGNDKRKVCVDDGEVNFDIEEMDRIPNIKSNWPVHVIKKQGGYRAGFKGWGGWGDKRDYDLCLSFAYMYHIGEPSSG